MRDEWTGIPSGYAYYGITHAKGAEIFFVSTNKKDLDNFIKEYFAIMKIENDREEDFEFSILYQDYPGVGTVYPYDRIGSIEDKLDNGTIIFGLDVPDERRGRGYWTKKYIRVSPSRMKKMPDYVF